MAQTVGTIYNQADLVESKTEYMDIPFTVVGLVIGQQGRNIRQQVTGDIQLCQAAANGSGGNVVQLIGGSLEGDQLG